MNRAQALAIEPDGTGLRWQVQQIIRPRSFYIAPVLPPAEPKLRSPESFELWRVICTADAPLYKLQWMDLAGLHEKRARWLGHTAIRNLLKGGWVREKDGRYRKP